MAVRFRPGPHKNMGLIWIIVSYLLGSIPFGFLISKLSGKNVLEIGWKKTSGSNVFKNVGKWQGILTGLLDVAKGSLAVLVAQKLGLSVEAQVFSGFAAVVGHNWSVFLRFSGGRGIGTFVGVLLVFSPKILGFFIIPLAIFGAAWTSSIGTLFGLVLIIYFLFYPPSFLQISEVETAGALTVFTLIPIFLKRLSPVGEIWKSQKKLSLVASRLIFDNDEASGNFRLKRSIMKPIANTLMVPPKMGWRVAKYGAGITKNGVVAVKDGVKKYILGESEKVVLELKVDDFKKMMVAAAKKIVIHQEEINRINVFPVADKDTGYNLAATLLGVEGTVSQKSYPDLRELTKDMKDAAMINARGNAGMITTGYFVEVLGRIKHLDSIDAFHLALAMQRGIKAARLSISEPVEGTILDTIKVAGEKAFEMAKGKQEKNIIKVLEEAYRASLIALSLTKEKLKVLKDNDVVDAGALGYVKILEAWIESLKGLSPELKIDIPVPVIQPKAEGELEFRYEVVGTFRQPNDFNLELFKNDLSLLGNSLEIIRLEDRFKFHIHTSNPQPVIDKAKDFPEADFKTEDMQAGVQIIERKPLGLVVDEIADLPKEFLEKHGIEEVAFTTRFSDGEIVSSKDEIYPKMKEALKSGRPLSTTSAPSFKEFLSTYNRALEKFEKILVITATSKLSGTYSSARIARSTFQKPAKLNIYVFDSFTAEVAEGLIDIKAQELISQGKTMEEIVDILREFSPKVILLGYIDDFRYVVSGGRLKLPRFLLGPISLIQKLRVKPLILLKNSKVKIFKVAFGKKAAQIMFKEVEAIRKGKKIRVAIAHAGNPDGARELKEKLEQNPNIEVAFVSSVSPVIGTHAGPGALLVGICPVDN